MKTLKQSIAIFAGQITLLGAAALFTPYTAQGQKAEAQPSPIPAPINVKVINTESEPVPVSGTINVGNLGSSPLPVTGTVNVGNLGDSPLPVRDVDNPAWQPVRFSSSFTVPAGKRLVIEYVSAAYSTELGCGALEVGLFSGLFLLQTFFPSVVGVDVTGNHLRGLSQETRVYVNAGSTVRFESHGSNCTHDVNNRNVTGYLVDVP